MRHSLITGGSSGIGLAIAAKLLERGECVSLLARDVDRLIKVQQDFILRGFPGHCIAVLPADVSDARAVSVAVAKAVEKFGPIDALYASAGIVLPALFKDQTYLDFDLQITTNVVGVANAVRSVFATMHAHGRGKIMIISSGAGLVGIPGYTAYCASKYALRGFASALRLEAKSSGITVTICFPPDTQTPQFQEEMHVRPPQAHLFMGRSKPYRVDYIADAIVRGLDMGKREIFFTRVIALLGWCGPLLAPFLERIYMTRLQRLKTS